MGFLPAVLGSVPGLGAVGGGAVGAAPAAAANIGPVASGSQYAGMLEAAKGPSLMDSLGSLGGSLAGPGQAQQAPTPTMQPMAWLQPQQVPQGVQQQPLNLLSLLSGLGGQR